MGIGIARILSGRGLFPQTSLPFLVVALKTQAETAKLTTPTLPISPAQLKFPKIGLLLCYGVALATFPVN